MWMPAMVRNRPMLVNEVTRPRAKVCLATQLPEKNVSEVIASLRAKATNRPKILWSKLSPTPRRLRPAAVMQLFVTLARPTLITPRISQNFRRTPDKLAGGS